MMLHLRATVLPGDVEREVFVTDHGTITFESSGAADARTVLNGGFLLPGLVDAHAHLAVGPGAPEDLPDAERSRAAARADLDAGVLLVREPGSPNRASTGIGPNDGLPRVQTSGRFLAGVGRYLPGFAQEVTDDELPDAALRELAAGTGWVKAIGDWRGDSGEGWVLGFAPDALAVAVRVVHDAGGRFAIHAIGPEAVEAAIAAGPDSIEHATYATDHHFEAMAAAGIAVTPTLNALLMARKMTEQRGASPEELARIDEGIAGLPARVRTAHEAGVTLMAGTDAALPHGQVWREIVSLAAAGIPNDAALAAGSWAARSFLGLPGIEEGAPADLVAFDRDPRESLEVLATPSVIVLDGRVIERMPADV